VIDLWPADNIPGPAAMVDGEERDLTKDSENLVAGERVIRLGHVSTPQIEVRLAPSEVANGSAVVICPGGGFHILAWDLEGTEVAAWLNGLGVAAIVLKYRVPTGSHGKEMVASPGDPNLKATKTALGPMMDAQRALSLTRANAEAWKLNPARIGVLGFSAGGHTAALAALANGRRAYVKLDATDEASCAANFALLIYPAWLVNDAGELLPHLTVTKETPAMFFAHASDDCVSCLSSTGLFTALKKQGVAADLHVFAKGGHGYGLRPTDMPVTHWPALAEGWMYEMGLLGAQRKEE
jgi:acetyl esterase/lipase